MKPAAIDYLNLHSRSTRIGDISEMKAVERVFGTHTTLHINYTKSTTGHLLGAANACEAIACINAIPNSIIPPTINTKKR